MAFQDLFLPLEDADFLVPSERVYYRRRRHIAVLLQPTFEFAVAVSIFVWMLVGAPLVGQSLVMSSLGIPILVLLTRLVMRVDWKSPKAMAGLAAFGLLVYVTQVNAPTLGLGIVTGMAIRLGLRAARWYWFRRIIITDRRVIEVDGLLTSSVASMPLDRVTDAQLYRSVLAELLGFAEFRVESAGQNQALARINFLDDPDMFHLLMVQLAATSQTTIPLTPDAAHPPRIFDQNAI